VASQKGQARTNTDSRKESPSSQAIAPLFARIAIPADDIMEITLERLVGPRDEHVQLAKSDFCVDGDPKHPFAINPYQHNEQDLQAQFGGGTYWIEARRKPDGAVMKDSGRRLVLDGRPKTDSIDEEEEEDDDDDIDARNEPAVRLVPKEPDASAQYIAMIERQLQRQEASADQQMRLTKEHAEKETKMAREHASKEVEMHHSMASTMLQLAHGKETGASEELVRLLRDEISSLRTKHERDLDEFRRSNREELTKRDRTADEAGRDLKRSAERDLDDARRRYQVQEDDTRRRWHEDIAEMKARYERELTQTRGEVIEVRTKLQGDLDRARHEADARIRELERENIDLEKQLNAKQAEVDAAENAPPGGPGMFDRIIALAQTDAGKAMLAPIVQGMMTGATGAPGGVPQMPLSVPAGPMPQSPEMPQSMPPGFPPQSSTPAYIPPALVPVPWMPPMQVASPPTRAVTMPAEPAPLPEPAEIPAPVQASAPNGAAHPVPASQNEVPLQATS
jgi:hypothetical protein